MERIEGETLARRLLRDPQYVHARQVMTAQLGTILAAHPRVPIEVDALAGLPGVRDEAAAGRRRARAVRAALSDARAGAASRHRVRVSLARRARPAHSGRVLVHGDYRIGNVMFGPEGVRVILDWEQAHVGRPDGGSRVDVRPCLALRQARCRSAASGSARSFFARTSGPVASVDPEVVRFWEAFGDLKWAVICIAQAKTYLDGGVKSVELASIGRRTAEAEYDLLAAGGLTMQDRPDARELLEAVRAFLEEQVVPALDGTAAVSRPRRGQRPRDRRPRARAGRRALRAEWRRLTALWRRPAPDDARDGRRGLAEAVRR